MQHPPPFVDIHCHLLPGVDDGPTNWHETLAMAELAVADGISTVVVTPHQSGSYALNTANAIRTQTTQLQQFLQQRGVTLRVLPGAEVRVEPDVVAKLRGGELLSLADQCRHVLLELPYDVYLPLDRPVSQLRAVGMAAVLAHPERNLGILRKRHVLSPLVEAGCLLQLTAGSLTGTFGPDVRKLALWMLRQRLVHLIGTDAHGAKSRRPLIRRAFECVAHLAGYDVAVELCCRNPALVATGRNVPLQGRESCEPAPTGWLLRHKAG